MLSRSNKYSVNGGMTRHCVLGGHHPLARSILGKSVLGAEQHPFSEDRLSPGQTTSS